MNVLLACWDFLETGEKPCDLSLIENVGLKVTTSQMNDYGRSGPAEGNWSRYGAVEGLSATTQEMILKRDRSFTFAIDALDEDETAQQLAAASALARQNREVVIPEVDAYVYGIMRANAGHKPAAKALTAENIYTSDGFPGPG